MGAFRDWMFANMRLRNFSPRTIKAYLWQVKEFTRHFGKAPDLLGEGAASSTYSCPEISELILNTKT